MDPQWVLGLITFAMLHWVLAIMLLHDLANRRRVLGGRKWPWAVLIVFLTFLGSVLYLLSHPQIFTEEQ